MPTPAPAFGQYEHDAAVKLAELALEEDLEHGSDVTSAATIPAAAKGTVRVVSRESGVLAGLPVIQHVLDLVDREVSVTVSMHDGDVLAAGDCAAVLEGHVRSLLTAERTILNFLTHLSGIATLAQRYVAAVEGTSAVILDTRKTLPGWRRLAKYAVRCGGGTNHRMGLFDGVLIKDNHIASWRERDSVSPLAAMINEVREHVHTPMPIEIEVDTIEQLEAVLTARPDIVLLDNMTNDQLKQAVSLRDAECRETKLEASGGVNLETVRLIAETGVDRISVGAITHSVTNFDLGFDWG